MCYRGSNPLLFQMRLAPLRRGGVERDGHGVGAEFLRQLHRPARGVVLPVGGAAQFESG
jgi:hypothetical protein